MATPRTTNDNVVDLVLREIRPISAVVQDTATRVAVMDEKLSQVQKSLQRTEYAVFGNGTPGLRAVVDNHDKAIAEIKEECGSNEDLGDVIRTLDDRIKVFEEDRKASAARKEKELDEARKTRWAIIFFIATTVIELVVKLFSN